MSRSHHSVPCSAYRSPARPVDTGSTRILFNEKHDGFHDGKNYPRRACRDLAAGLHTPVPGLEGRGLVGWLDPGALPVLPRGHHFGQRPRSGSIVPDAHVAWGFGFGVLHLHTAHQEPDWMSAISRALNDLETTDAPPPAGETQVSAQTCISDKRRPQNGRRGLLDSAPVTGYLAGKTGQNAAEPFCSVVPSPSRRGDQGARARCPPC